MQGKRVDNARRLLAGGLDEIRCIRRRFVMRRRQLFQRSAGPSAVLGPAALVDAEAMAAAPRGIGRGRSS